MTFSHYVIARMINTPMYRGPRVVADLPDVQPGTSIRLEFTEDGWVNRGVLHAGLAHVYDSTDALIHVARTWVDAPSTETNETDRTEDPC